MAIVVIGGRIIVVGFCQRVKRTRSGAADPVVFDCQLRRSYLLPFGQASSLVHSQLVSYNYDKNYYFYRHKGIANLKVQCQQNQKSLSINFYRTISKNKPLRSDLTQITYVSVNPQDTFPWITPLIIPLTKRLLAVSTTLHAMFTVNYRHTHV